MTQHDQNIANADGATVRADINAALVALFGNSSGATEPSTTVAYQFWADTTTGLLKIRNAANSGWVSIGPMASIAFGLQQQASNVASASTIGLDAATGVIVDVTGTTTITAITLAQGSWRLVRFTGALTLTNGSSLLLPGAANIATAAGDYALVVGYASSVVRCAAYIPIASSPLGTTGTAVHKGLLDLSASTAGQIKFPASQNASANANTLDDYEEGTWTPALTFATPGNLSIAYTTQTGTYTKIGRSVLLKFNILTSTFTHTTASGALTLSGLPFASAAGVTSVGSGPWQGITKANYTQLDWSVANGASVATGVMSGSGQSLSNAVPADMPTGGTVNVQGSIIYDA